MATLIASYRTTAAGYDAAGTRLIDESGFGNHLPLISGTPDFTGSYDSRTAFKMFGTAYFGGDNILPPIYTVISVIHPNLNSGETLNYFWAAQRDYADSDPGYESPSTNFESGVNILYGPYGQIGASSGKHGNGYYNTSGSTGLSVDDWNVVTDIWNPETSLAKKRFGTASFMTGAIDQHYQGLMIEDFRLGFRPTAITTTGSYHLGCLRMDIYVGDYATDDPVGYQARIDALIANPAL